VDITVENSISAAAKSIQRTTNSAVNRLNNKDRLTTGSWLSLHRCTVQDDGHFNFIAIAAMEKAIFVNVSIAATGDV